MKSVRALVSGRVQGVWYRGWTVEQARHQGVTGWVRNRRDGSVEAVLSGPSENVDALLELLWRGPGPARVTGVDVTPCDPPSDPGFHQLPSA